MRFLLFCFSILTLIGCKHLLPEINTEYAITVSKTDSVLVVAKLDSFRDARQERPGQFLVEIGKSFIDAPYVGKTLEIGDTETVVINLHEFDCTTFLETSLSIFNTLKMGGDNLKNYSYVLKQMRYREGKVGDYTTRVHYFTDWITNNITSGYVKDYTKNLGGLPYPNDINFMSTHTSAYKQLSADSSLVPKIALFEKEISTREYFYIPKNKIAEIEYLLDDGMIIGITTNIKGLDIIHTGILVRQGERIHLLHASSDYKKVMVTEQPLVDYLAGNKLQTGIIVLRIH